MSEETYKQQLEENLRATQQRCTELIVELRALKETIPFIDPFVKELTRAREKHPVNSRGRFIAALGEEVGELCEAYLENQSEERQLEEAIQIAVVVFRYMKDAPREEV